MWYLMSYFFSMHPHNRIASYPSKIPIPSPWIGRSPPHHPSKLCYIPTTDSIMDYSTYSTHCGTSMNSLLLRKIKFIYNLLRPKYRLALIPRIKIFAKKILPNKINSYKMKTVCLLILSLSLMSCHMMVPVEET